VFRKVSACLASFLLITTAESASVDGIDIYSIEEGEGPTVVFVHGAFGNLSYWDAQLEAFSADYRVLALDLPGHGMSESPPSEELSLELFAKAIDAVRQEAGVDEIVLVGHSMGVSVIRKYVSLFPEHVTALIAVDATLDLRRRRSGGSGGTPPDLSFPTTREGMETQVRANFVPETPIAVQLRVLELVVPRMLNRSPDIDAMFRRGDSLLSSNEVVEVPALHILAESNFLTQGSRDPDTIREVIPNASFETIPGTGHFLHMEKPAEFNRILRDFLESLDI
jgi:pimeloyl-ACP methyl ester carboxylesterase